MKEAAVGAFLFLLAVCLMAWLFTHVHDWLDRRRARRARRFCDKRFSPDQRDLQKYFAQYETPSILRRQAE